MQFSRIKRVSKVCIILLLGLAIGWGVFEFFITNGDGFNPIENSTVMKQGYENACKTFLERGIYKIEVSSGKKQITITDLDVIDSLLKTLGKIEVGYMRLVGAHQVNLLIQKIISMNSRFRLFR